MPPPKARRDMAILGFLHRVNIGLVSNQIRDLFPPVTHGSDRAFAPRTAARIHNRQLLDRVTRDSSEQFKGSIFGMVQCYNSLPQEIVDKKDVKTFQRSLQEGLRTQARAGNEEWQTMLSVGRRYASLIKFQAFFRR